MKKTPNKENITVKTILGLLEIKHSKDVFVPECKDGPSQFQTHRRMDAWVMPRSWSKPACTAYEIKLTRSDFLQDDKWPAYLNMCNIFYFVTPQNTIQINELPAEAGLLQVSKTGTKLYTKKKAPIRDIIIPEDVFRYILMCRTTIKSEYGTSSKKDYWKRWLAEKDEKKYLGSAVSKKLSSLAQERIYKVETENIRLKSENKTYSDIKKILKDAGIDSWTRWDIERQVQKAMQYKILNKIPEKFAIELENIRQAIEKLQTEWNNVINEKNSN